MSTTILTRCMLASRREEGAAQAPCQRTLPHPTQRARLHSKKTKVYEKAERQIHCVWDNWGKWYIAPDGLVFRCCWTGGHYYDQGEKRFYYPPKFERMFNGFEVPIQKIISYDYWSKLQTYLSGYERSFSLCKSQCGKIVSSIEKTEENLKTGEKTVLEYNTQEN